MMKRFFEAANFSASASLFELQIFPPPHCYGHPCSQRFVTHAAARYFKLLATKEYGRKNPGRILFISTSVVARQA
jgi:hypothetical protein